MATATKGAAKSRGSRARAKATGTAATLPELGTKYSFVGREGREVALKDPDGKPSEGQLYALLSKGMLAVVSPGTVTPFTKAQASWALDTLKS